MRLLRGRTPVTLLLAGALLLAACGDDDEDGAASSGAAATTADTTPAGGAGDDDDDDAAKGELTVGSFNFSESLILAHMYGGALEAAGYDVDVRENLGNREVVAPALVSGEIDLYPGYAATDLEFFNGGAGQATPDAEDTVEKLNAAIEDDGLEALTPSPAIDANAIVVTAETAEEHGLEKVSDLAAIDDQLSFGGPPECPERPFCALGLKDKYGIEFGTFRPLDAGGPLTKAALDAGEVQVALLFSSDGSIAEKGWVVLDDDKQLQNADNVVVIARTESLDDDAREILDEVSAALTTGDLTELNKRADIDKEDPADLAEEWLADHDLA